MSYDLIRPGTSLHWCDRPSLDLKIRHGAVWRCDCGRRWRLHVERLGRTSWRGQWVRYYWPWPRG